MGSREFGLQNFGGVAGWVAGWVGVPPLKQAQVSETLA